MSKWIDADALKERLIQNITLTNAIDKSFSEAPSIDIVFCKECKWGKPYSDKQLECDALGLGGLKFPDDFCSYGQKGDENVETD